MLQSFNNFTVTIEADSGLQLQELMQAAPVVPEILLLDVNMPGMDGIQTARWVTENYPLVKIAALSMNDKDNALLGMMEAGCCSYLLKNTHPTELEIALQQIADIGYYNGDSRHINFKKLMGTSNHLANLTKREKAFIPYVCSDLTYKVIADKMKVSESTIENYRKSLFTKFNVQSRTGLVIEAIRRKLIDL